MRNSIYRNEILADIRLNELLPIESTYLNVDSYGMNSSYLLIS